MPMVFFEKYLFVWLCQALAVALRLLALVGGLQSAWADRQVQSELPRQGSNPWALHWEGDF